jgi:N-acetyl-anhydromuramyl-L-alanine amidase AmpD
MIKVNEIEGFNPVGRYKNKKQIVLTHTSRKLTDYVFSLKYRYNGNNKKLPHYIIDLDGMIYNLIPPNTYSDYMEVNSYNKQSIVISLENLGWLRKNPLTNNYINWIGNEYNDEVYKRKWRGHYFWHPYTEKQITSLVEITDYLCNEFNIPKVSIGHNVKVDKIEKFRGIATNSNYDVINTDLNPAFDFDIFINKIKDE